jgi:O-antigen ligase
MSKALPWLVPAYLVLCLVLGGASNGGFAENAALQLLAVGLIGAAWWAAHERPLERPEAWLLLLSAAALVVIAAQFVPLPIGLWRTLSGRADILASLQQAHITMRHGFVSLIPHESLKSAIWLLPALGVLLVMARVPTTYSGRRLAIALIGAMVLAVVVGAMQKAAGPTSELYFYRITNPGFAVGFFANVNHMASLLLATIPFQAALLHEAIERRSNSRIMLLTGVGASLAVTVVGIVVVGSLAGYGLLLPVCLASALIVKGTRRTRSIAALLMLPAVLGGMAFVLLSPDGQALLDSASAMSAGSRQTIFATTWTAIRDFWPVGSGLGTFAEIYPSYEDPFSVMRAYVNHAHNDYLELALETGIAGLTVLGAFLIWWAVRGWGIWGDNTSSPYAKAAVIASAALLIHSLVDYPLRTAGLSAVFAACLGLMAAPLRKRWRTQASDDFGRRNAAERGSLSAE